MGPFVARERVRLSADNKKAEKSKANVLCFIQLNIYYIFRENKLIIYKTVVCR